MSTTVENGMSEKSKQEKREENKNYALAMFVFGLLLMPSGILYLPLRLLWPFFTPYEDKGNYDDRSKWESKIKWYPFYLAAILTSIYYYIFWDTILGSPYDEQAIAEMELLGMDMSNLPEDPPVSIFPLALAGLVSYIISLFIPAPKIKVDQ